jgi:hypothetical protein
MDNPSYSETKAAISQWIESSSERLRDKNITFEVVKDNMNCLRVELDFGEISAEILVEKPNCAPYRYVSLQAAAIVNGVLDLLYFWYDEDGMSIENIIDNLDRMITIIWKKENNG